MNNDLQFDFNLSLVLGHSILYESKCETSPGGVADGFICGIWGGGYAQAGTALHAAMIAAEEARKAREATLAHEKEVYQQSRGAPWDDGRISALFPVYSGEGKLWEDARGIYDATSALMGSTADRYNRYGGYVAGVRPIFDAGTGQVGGLYAGDVLREQLAEAAPVATARRNVALGQKQSVYDAMFAQLSKLEAERARQGFTGGSSFDRNRAGAVRSAGLQKASETMTLAELDNAMAIQAIREADRQNRYKFLDFAPTRVQQSMAMDRLPLEGVTADYENLYRILQPWRISPTSYNPTPYQAIPSALQLGLTAAGGAIGATTNAMAQKRLQEQQAQQNRDLIAALGRIGAQNYQQQSATGGFDSGGKFYDYGAYDAAVPVDYGGGTGDFGSGWDWDNPGG